MAARITMFALVMLSLVTYAATPSKSAQSTKTQVMCCDGDPICSPVHGCPKNGSTK